ncbi:MAG: DUF2914 domain-containing protein [Patescibacteria group bacterium]
MFSFEKLRTFVAKYERHLSAGALAGGFLVDTLTFQRIDFLFGHAMLFAYLFIAAASIVFMNARAAGRWTNRFSEKTAPFFPLFAQYAFGGLFSAFAIFYTKSASITASWPFLIFIFALLLGNETFRTRYQKFGFQITLFFIVLFSFLIFYFPVVLGEISTRVFLLSGAASLLLIVLFTRALFFIAPAQKEKGRKIAIQGIGGAFLLINFMYFANIIPPIPLALKDAGVYNDISRTPDGAYQVLAEKTDWRDMLAFQKNISIAPGDAVYFFSSVFAPTRLHTNIVHEWQYFDEEKRTWTTTTKVAFPITGGSDGGYRGYSMKTSVFPGFWRVRVVTERGAVIGQRRFTISYAEHIPVLSEEIK